MSEKPAYEELLKKIEELESNATDTVTWSEELFRIFQIDPDETAPSWVAHLKLYHPDDLILLKQAVDPAVADGTPCERKASQ